MIDNQNTPTHARAGAAKALECAGGREVAPRDPRALSGAASAIPDTAPVRSNSVRSGSIGFDGFDSDGLTVPRDLVALHGLTWNARAVWSHLHDLESSAPAQGTPLHPGKASIALALDLTEKQLEKAMRDLVAAGLLEVEGRSGRTSVYRTLTWSMEVPGTQGDRGRSGARLCELEAEDPRKPTVDGGAEGISSVDPLAGQLPVGDGDTVRNREDDEGDAPPALSRTSENLGDSAAGSVRIDGVGSGDEAMLASVGTDDELAPETVAARRGMASAARRLLTELRSARAEPKALPEPPCAPEDAAAEPQPPTPAQPAKATSRETKRAAIEARLARLSAGLR